MTRGRPRTRAVTQPQALQFATKAEEFLLTAEEALSEPDSNSLAAASQNS